jgi:hypothetical protein
VSVSRGAATRPRSARFDWGEDGSRVHATFAVKDEGRSVVAVQHARLADAGEAERMKAMWREHLAAPEVAAGAGRCLTSGSWRRSSASGSSQHVGDEGEHLRRRRVDHVAAVHPRQASVGPRLYAGRCCVTTIPPGSAGDGSVFRR